MEEIKYYSANMSDGSSRFIGDMEDVKQFLQVASKQDKGLIVTKYSVVNPAFVVSISQDGMGNGKQLPDPEFQIGLSDNKLLN